MPSDRERVSGEERERKREGARESETTGGREGRKGEGAERGQKGGDGQERASVQGGWHLRPRRTHPHRSELVHESLVETPRGLILIRVLCP